MQLTCSTDSVIQFLERLYPASTGEINCSWRGRERESGRREEKGVSLAAVDGIQGCSLEEYKEGKGGGGRISILGRGILPRGGEISPDNIAAANCKVSRVAEIFEQLIISTSGQLNKTNRRRATSPKKNWLSPATSG